MRNNITISLYKNIIIYRNMCTYVNTIDKDSGKLGMLSGQINSIESQRS